MTDPTTKVLREAMAAIVDVAPQPPDLPTVPDVAVAPRWNRMLVVAGAFAITLVFGLVAVYVAGGFSSEGQVAAPGTTTAAASGSTEATTTSSAAVVATTSSTAESVGPIQVIHPVRIDCSIEVPSFPCGALIDGEFGDSTKVWNAPEGGVDSEITLFFDPPVEITEMVLRNIEDPERFTRNARIRGLEIGADDLAQTTILELDDTNAEQRIQIRSLRTSSLTLRITGVYPGQAFDGREPFRELALAEIEFHGRISSDLPSSPTTSIAVVGGQSWLSSGEPVTDERLFAVLGGPDYPYPEYVSGSAIQLAWSPAYLGEFEIGLFAVQQGDPLNDDQWYCLTAYGAPIGRASSDYAGGQMCAPSLEVFERMISEFGFGGGGSCAGWLGNVAYVWGVPADVESVEFRLRDGTALTANVDDNGYALVAWDQDTPLAAVTYEGITSDHTELLDSFRLGNGLSCAEMAS